MTANLNFFAGGKALALTREKGLRPDDVKVMAGAAGGPKWLVLGHLDRVIFGDWFRDRTDPLFLLGSSAGAWRFAAAACKDPLAAIDRFEEAYIGQTYQQNPPPQEVSREARRILKYVMGANGLEEILTHPCLRLNIMTVQSRGITASDAKAMLGLGLAGTALGNLISRRAVAVFFRRGLFYHPEDLPPFFHMPEFPILKTALSKENLKGALLASGSIPLLMSGVSRIPGTSGGVYRDGALIDYHMDIPMLSTDGIVLYPHFSDRIIPGWFDKKLSWRRPSARHMDPVLLVVPTRTFISRLPHGKIPDRKDFWRFKGRDRERIAYWKRVAEMSKALVDEFMEAVNGRGIRKVVKPMRHVSGC